MPISGLEFGNADFNGGRKTGEPGDKLLGQSEDLFNQTRLIWRVKELLLNWYNEFSDILLLDNCNLNVIQLFLLQRLAIKLFF